MNDLTPIRLPDPGFDWRCQRCDGQWRSKKPGDSKPVACAKCRSAYWDKVKVARSEGVEARVESKRKRHVKKKNTRRPQDELLDTITASTMREIAPQPWPQPQDYDGGRTIRPAIEYSNEGILPPPPHLRRTNTRARELDSSLTPEEALARKGD